MEIRKIIIYITRDGALHTTQERARKHVKRASKAQAESACALDKLFKAARLQTEATPGRGTSSALAIGSTGATEMFTQGTHKERILAGHKRTSDIKRTTGIKANVLYADLGKLRSEKIITPTNRLKSTRAKAKKPSAPAKAK